MRRIFLLIVAAASLSACMTVRSSRPAAPIAWDQRVTWLQRAADWQLDGRAAVALGQDGWQASLNWRQSAVDADLHLAGPLGVGATTLRLTAAGLSVNGAPPGAAVVAQLQDKLGFALPLDNLRYWLLGVPDPRFPFELTRNAQDRAQQLTQAGWTIGYDRYVSVDGDLLPALLVLNHDGARVRIAVDHWTGPR